jgi:DNA-binding beta-propeller fold protein YncE
MSKKIVASLAAVVVIAAGAVGYYVMGRDSAPSDVVYGDLESYVFIQSTTTPELTVIDAIKDVIVGRIKTTVVPDDILVAKEPKRIVYSNRANKSVHIYDLATQKDEAVFNLPFSPDNVVMSPDSFVLAMSDTNTGQFGIIDLSNNRLTHVLDEKFYRPSAIVFSDDSVFVFISDSLNGRITTIDTLSGAVLDPIQISLHADKVSDPEGNTLSAVTRTPNGVWGIVTEKLVGRVSVINFRNWSEFKVMAVGKGPSRAYGTADGQYMLIGNDVDRTVSVISTDNFDHEATLPGVDGVTSITTGFFETLAYVVSNKENKCVVIDLTKMEKVNEIALPGGPGEAVADVDGKKMYVPLHNTNELAIIDVYNQKIHKIIKNVADKPWGVAMATTNNYCH